MKQGGVHVCQRVHAATDLSVEDPEHPEAKGPGGVEQSPHQQHVQQETHVQQAAQRRQRGRGVPGWRGAW